MGVSSLQDVRTLKFWVALLAEFIGTAFLVLVACGSCANFKNVAYQDPVDNSATTVQTTASSKIPLQKVLCAPEADLVKISLSFGFSVATIVWIIARVSGGHINPAVTFGFLVTRKISVIRALLYIVVQCLGALLGAALLGMVSPPEAMVDDLLPGHSAPHQHAHVYQTLAVEMFITFVLVFTVFATCDSQRKDISGSGPLAIGLAIAMCHLWAIPYTGSGMNPARVLGVAVVSNQFDVKSHWAYWLGPLLGAAQAAMLYDFVFAVNATSEKLRGFLTRNYDDSNYDSNGRKSASPDVPLKSRA